MPMVCPVCSKSYERQLQCPQCAVSLMYQPETKPEGDQLLPPHWSRTPWGRIALGIVLAQGLFYAVFQLLLAANELLGEFYGSLAVQILQMLALFAGSLLVGAGQKNGWIYGAILGIWNSVLFLVAENIWGEKLSEATVYAQPVLHVAFGAFGGVVGSWIWSPPDLSLPLDKAARKAETLRRDVPKLRTTQVHWARVLTGVAIVIGGCLWADRILLELTPINVNRPTIFQKKVMTWEIMALAIFLGGAFAGATTWNGTVQGAWVGLLGAAALLGITYWSDKPLEFGTAAVIQLGCILGLSLFGGWFGAKLLPPVVRNVSRPSRPMPV